MVGISAWHIDIATTVVAFLLALMITPLVRKYAVRWKLGDKPNGRKINTHVIPHLGGIAIVLGTVGGVAVFGLLGDGGSILKSTLSRTIPAVGVIVSLGLIDDMKNLRAIQKLAVQILAALMLSLSGLTLATGLGVVDSSPLLVLVVSSVFFVGMSSALNLIDGHDGLAAGVSLLSATAFAIVSWQVGAPEVLVLSLAIAGACLGFLFFNFPPGKIYMGDNGSMFLGTVLAIIACAISTIRPSFYTLCGICLILGIPILDAILAIVRRLALRCPVFRADSLHMHHVLHQAGYSSRRTVGLLYAMQAFLCVLGVATAAGYVVPAILGVTLVLVLFVSFIRMMVTNRQQAVGRVSADIAHSSIPIKGNLHTNISGRRRSVGG